MRTLRLLISAALAGCAADVDRSGELPQTAAHFREVNPAARDAARDASLANVPPQGEWWRVFADPVLDDLVQRSSRSNRDIHLAAARLAQARALRKSATADLIPRLNLSGDVSRVSGPLTNAAAGSGTLFVSGLNASYEPDLFGRASRAEKAGQLDVVAAEHALRAARLLVAAEVAQTYFTLRALDEEREMVRGTARSERASSRLTEGLAQSGLASTLAVVRLRAEADSVASDALALDRRRAELEHALAVLVGETASVFTVTAMARTPVLPHIPENIPGTVLARRPDVQAAQQSMFAAHMRVGVARDSWLPSITLTGLLGLAAPGAGSLLQASALATAAGAGLRLPILDGGRYEARVEKADAELDEAVARYAQQILVGIKEVEDSSPRCASFPNRAPC